MRALRVLVVACAVLASWAQPRVALAAFDYNDTTWEGTSELLDVARKRLGRNRVELRARLDWSELEPGDGLLVLHPKVSLEYDEASAFLRDGGRIALLDDYGEGAAFLERFQIRRVPAPLRPGRTLRRNANLAIAFPAVQRIAGYEHGRHPVVAGVQQLVTNHPTALLHPDLTPVLRIPAVGEPDATLAVTGIIVKKGRLFAMGDPSAVINLMMRYPGNRAFAEGVVDYLVEDDSWGKRGGRLFLVANDFDQAGRVGGEGTLLGDIADYFDGFREFLADVRRTGLPDFLAIVLAALCALGAVVWVGVTTGRVYPRALPRFARATPLVAQGGVAGRAAVLAAPTTHRALVMLELKAALEEGLALRLGFDARTAWDTLRAEIMRQGALSRRTSDELTHMYRELTEAETAVAASQPIRITERAVAAARARMDAIFAELDERRSDRS